MSSSERSVSIHSEDTSISQVIKHLTGVLKHNGLDSDYEVEQLFPVMLCIKKQDNVEPNRDKLNELYGVLVSLEAEQFFGLEIVSNGNTKEKGPFAGGDKNGRIFLLRHFNFAKFEEAKAQEIAHSSKESYVEEERREKARINTILLLSQCFEKTGLSAYYEAMPMEESGDIEIRRKNSGASIGQERRLMITLVGPHYLESHLGSKEFLPRSGYKVSPKAEMAEKTEAEINRTVEGITWGLDVRKKPIPSTLLGANQNSLFSSKESEKAEVVPETRGSKREAIKTGLSGIWASLNGGGAHFEEKAKTTFSDLGSRLSKK